jgi:oligo-1,6-glucosidase
MFETKNIPAELQGTTVKATEMPSTEWWKECIIYQVYPRSFKDSNGDGIGDIPGIISKLDYIKSLGVKAVWLNPVYASPNDDNGYDISDYCSIMKEFGTMEDFNALLKGLHERGIGLLMDLVVNHTSDEHEWFRQARSSRDNPYRDFYHWWPKEKGTPPRRMSFFDPKGDAWEFDEHTNAWYLHYFSKKQPDLNWDNPRLRQEIYKMMAFWFEKGVDGFRMDAISFISKDNSYPVISKRDIKEKYHSDWAYYYSSGPHLHEYLQEMNKEVLSKYPVVAVAEAPGINKNEALLFVHSERNELHMMYHFEGMVLGRLPEGFKRPDPNGYKLQDFKRVYSEWDYVFEREGWGTIYLCNHDQPRMVSRWGNDAPEFRVPSAKLLITFLLTMRATPIFYNGDELGMINIKFDKIDDYRDIETHTMYSNVQSKGGNLKQFLEDQKASARDNSRTPFQWDATENAGFCSGTPWIKINPDYLFVNEEAQNADKNSVLNYFRCLADLRNNRQVFIYGHYTLYDEADAQVYAYTRIWGKEGVLVVLNFSKELVQYNIPSPLDIKEKPIVNSETVLQLKERCITLLPYQALVFELAP